MGLRASAAPPTVEAIRHAAIGRAMSFATEDSGPASSSSATPVPSNRVHPDPQFGVFRISPDSDEYVVQANGAGLREVASEFQQLAGLVDEALAESSSRPIPLSQKLRRVWSCGDIVVSHLQPNAQLPSSPIEVQNRTWRLLAWCCSIAAIGLILVGLATVIDWLS